jgi:hypothetical protein
MQRKVLLYSAYRESGTFPVVRLVWDVLAGPRAGGFFTRYSDIHECENCALKAREAGRAGSCGVPELTCYNVVRIGEWASVLSPGKLRFNGEHVEVQLLRPFFGRREQKMEWLKSALDDLADNWRMLGDSEDLTLPIFKWFRSKIEDIISAVAKPSDLLKKLGDNFDSIGKIASTASRCLTVWMTIRRSRMHI